MRNNFEVRSKVPLVHCITNYVTVNDAANALLACGGSPIMADEIREVNDIVSISDALVLNIGTLNSRTLESMLAAGRRAAEREIPVVLDPVGAGASTLRNEAVKLLTENVKLSVIKGNLSEISFLAGLSAGARGVDSSEIDSENDAVQIAKTVAEKLGCVVVITGAIDVVSDGRRVAEISNGAALMSKVTGTGCMLSAITGAYAAVSSDLFEGVVCAVCSMGVAGEIAFENTANLGTGSFRNAIIDALSKIDDDTLSKRGKISYEKTQR